MDAAVKAVCIETGRHCRIEEQKRFPLFLMFCASLLRGFYSQIGLAERSESRQHIMAHHRMVTCHKCGLMHPFWKLWAVTNRIKHQGKGLTFLKVFCGLFLGLTWNKPKRFGKRSIWDVGLLLLPSSPLLPTSLPFVKLTSPRSCALPQFSLLLLLCSPYALMPPSPSSEKRGEMIQAPGMRGRAAAGHCTCSATKTSWRLHVQSRHVDVRARIYLIHQTPTLSFWQPPLQPPLFISRHFYFPAFIFFFFSVPTLLLSHKQQQANYKISARCLEGGSGLSHGPLSFYAAATHEQTLWEPVGTVFVLRWQEYPRRARVICAKIAFGTWEPQPPWPRVFQQIQPCQNSHFDWGLREKRYKVYETRGKTSDISFWSMASATCLPPPPLPP